MGSIAIIAPPAAAVGSALAVSILVPRPPGLGLAWWTAVIGTGIAVFMCGRRLERHAFALAALLGMAIVFPVRPPSRLNVVFTAARLPRPETQAQPATAGNGSGTKQAAVALAGALRAFDERTRREEPVLQRLGLGAVAVSIATIVASVTLGGTATSGRASRSRHGVAGGLAGGPTQPPVASGPAANSAPLPNPVPNTAGLTPSAPTAPVGSQVPAVVQNVPPTLGAASALAAPPPAPLRAAGADVRGAALGDAGAPIVTTAAEATLVSAASDGASDSAPPAGTPAGDGPILHATAVRNSSQPGAVRMLGAQAVGDLSVPGKGEVSAPPGVPGRGDSGGAGADGDGQPGTGDGRDAPDPAGAGTPLVP